MCMPGGQWQSLGEGDWPPCSDPTTTTPAPTTTAPQRSESVITMTIFVSKLSKLSEKPCYCLGDIDTVTYDSFRMNKNIHKEILKVCRKAWVTFGKVN